YFREADKQAKDSGKTRYYMKEGEYSLRVEEVYNNLKKEGLFSADLKELFNLGLEQYDPVKDEPVDRLAPFFDKMDKEVVSRIPVCGADGAESDTPVAVITAKKPLERPGLLEGKKGLDAKKSALVQRAREYSEELQIYYAKCVKTIRDSYRNIAETILSFDLHTDGEKVTSPLSFINGVLKTEGRFIHPVAAMVAIARAENYFRKKLADIKERPWEDLLKDKAGELPIDLYVDAMNETSCLGKNEKGDKSAYRKISDGRFLTLATGDAVRVADAYLQASSTDVCVDSKFLMADAVETAANVESSAKKQLKKAVYTLIVERLELLMEEYKRFFKNFEEEKGGLAQRTADYEKMNSGMSGGVINVGSSPEEKRKLYEEMNDDVSGASLEDLKDGYDVVGRSAFRMAYEIAKLKGNKGAYDEDDADTSRLFKGLFDSMVESYKQQISKGKFYEEFYEANVFEALAKGQNDPEKKRRAVGEKLGKVINLAEPSMKQDNLTSAELQSSQITVVMVPLKAAKYLRKNAASLGIVVQGDDTVGDPNNTRTYLPYAEQFVRACYPSQLKVVVASGIPDNVVYVTKENSDLQPIHIRDLCEDKDGTYYREYSKMVRIVDGISEDGKKIESTDIANPHLGFNLHKRGYLPFIDPKKEAESDTDMFKALLYGLFSGQITYGTMARRGTGFRYFENGKETSIRDGENRFVDMGNLAGLVQWIRPLVGKISEWSKEFDKALEAQCRSFPTVEDESASAVLEGWITRSQYVSYMRDNVFDEINKANKGGEQIKPASLMEFAYKIKTSEESTVDCDDAEKLLKVGYETLCTVCRFRIGRDSSDTLASVINQQTEKFVIALCTNIGLGSLGYARTILSWANNNGCFVDIPTDNNSLDRNGQFRVTAPFAFDEDWIEKRVNEELARRGKKADASAETPAADDEMQD
ncbi:MAG: hypothetical protein MJ078_02680, partial [Clostridia bacterium]|nr:hypothetical protein [Clostridia bacterium]